MAFRWLILAIVATTAFARSTSNTQQNTIEEQQQQQQQPRTQETSSIFGDLRYVFKVYQECAAKDLTPCLKLKLITAMDRVARQYAELPLFDGITFVKNANIEETTPVKTEEELENSLPRSLNEREDALNEIISNKVSNFFDTHSLQVKLPTSSELQRSFTEEARKKKKSSGLLILPLILGGTLIPLALGALALLAGKALIVSKLALVLAAIIGLKKLLSGSNAGHDSGHEVVVSGGHGASGWGRSYDKEQAQNLAYNAYAPKTR